MTPCEPGSCLIAEARGPLYECEGKCAYSETVRVSLDPRKPWPFAAPKPVKPKKINHSKFRAPF